MTTVYAVASAKGGVGKTTTTAALATVLAGAGADVVAVDADIGMANLAGALGVETGETTIHDVLAGRADPTDAVHEGPDGLRVVPGEVALDAYAAADPSGLREVVDAFDDADYVLLDAGAGLSHDSTLPLALADRTLLVSTPERDALGDTEKTRQLTDRLGGTVAGAAITRVDPDDPDPDVVAAVLDAPVLGRIPEDAAIRRADRAGESVVRFDPDAPASRAYRELARTLTGEAIPEPSPESADSDERESGETRSEGAAAPIGVTGRDHAGGVDDPGGTGDADEMTDADDEPEPEVDDDEPEPEVDDEDGEDRAGDDEADGSDPDPDEDVIVADAGPVGVVEEGDGEEIIVAGGDADERRSDGRDETGTLADRTDGTDGQETAADSEAVNGDRDPADGDEEASGESVASEPADTTDGADAANAAVDDDAAVDDHAEVDEEPDAGIPDAEGRDDIAAETAGNGGSSPTEPDETDDSDDELAGSVPFRDDDGGMETELTRAEDDDEEADDSKKRGGFFSRLFGR
ncbi:P-loop NTPase [Halorubrum sp. JWXQ-INN 858]|uniref:cell division ATPase MinD n=1 Tax=Halorubrum sp. JWXQ-INN 858 TaxID=2690782 RepID=UPI001359809E|nr:cell division ATPase MinD [Halorubrum sp. JWXQ-INN 858]MWV65975.1 P-loop NTPase [Halorubrum sp. JWXQ-INN 858]